MNPRLAMKHDYFTKITPHETKVVHARAIPYGSYDEATASLILAMIGLTLMAATVVSILIAFKVF